MFAKSRKQKKNHLWKGFLHSLGSMGLSSNSFSANRLQRSICWWSTVILHDSIRAPEYLDLRLLMEASNILEKTSGGRNKLNTD